MKPKSLQAEIKIIKSLKVSQFTDTVLIKCAVSLLPYLSSSIFFNNVKLI